MFTMITNTKRIVKMHKKELILVVLVFLISLFSFSLGFILGAQKEKPPLEIKDMSYEL